MQAPSLKAWCLPWPPASVDFSRLSAPLSPHQGGLPPSASAFLHKVFLLSSLCIYLLALARAVFAANHLAFPSLEGVLVTILYSSPLLWRPLLGPV